MRVTALIPAYRPGQSLVDVVTGLIAQGFPHIYVIDDGSGDDYREYFHKAAKLGARILTHPVNQGKGAALKTGISAIRTDLPDTMGIVTVDADGQHLPEDVAAVARTFAAQPRSLVLGARRFDDAPLRSRFGNELTRVMFRIFHGSALEDTQTGLRAFDLDFAQALLAVPSCRYEFELDMLILASRSQKAVISTPISTIYMDGNKSSHFNPLIDSVKIYFSLLRFSFAGICAAIIDNAVFAILIMAGLPIFSSQVVGRTIASVANYLMLKRMVFHSNQADRIAGPKYVALVVVFGLLSYGLILTSQSLFDANVITAKIIIETLIFLANYGLQRSMVFKERAL